jgi:hypothetical protein
VYGEDSLKAARAYAQIIDIEGSLKEFVPICFAPA